VLLHYATVISGLTERNVRLAQRVAMVEERLRLLEGDRGAAGTPGADDRLDERRRLEQPADVA
jgi:hypothetical protein